MPDERLESLLRHDGFVRRVAAAIAPDAAAADDVVQETYARALAPGRAPIEHPKAWLATVARNLARTLHTRRGARDRREQVAAERREPPSEPSEILVREELRQRVVQALLALDDPYRTVLTMRFYQDLPPREIARQLDRPVETIRTWTRRGIERLRLEMDTRYGGDRRAWLAAMLPILQFEPAPPSPVARAGAPVLVGAAAAAILLGGLLTWHQGPADSDAPETASRSTPRGAAEPRPVRPPEPPAPATTPPSPPPPEPTAPPPVRRIVRIREVRGSADPNAPLTPKAAPVKTDGASPSAAQVQPIGPFRRTAIIPPRMPMGGALSHVPARIVPRGMLRVPGGRAHIGTSDAELRNRFARHAAGWKHRVAYEAPVHHPRFDDVFLDQDEVSNLQYARFLDDTAARLHDTTGGSLRTLDAIARAYAGPGQGEDRSWIGWRQLYVENHGAIRQALGSRFEDVVVRDARGDEDLHATARRLRHEALPSELVLRCMARHVPNHWTGLRPSEAQQDEPVRYVSYLDARAYALWAGKHIPSEQVWEYAARGPEGRVYPWGNTMPRAKTALLPLVHWNDYLVDDRFKARPLPVGRLPDGASWCGVRGLAGNVSEWTSSWFRPYANHINAANPYARWIGQTVKVIRGGNAATSDPELMRCADRKFTGVQYPGERFAFVGIRCAWYRRPGRNQVEPVLARLARGRRTSPEMFEPARLAGAVVERFARPGPGTVHVTDRTHALMVIPTADVFRSSGPAWMQDAWKRAASYRATPGLLRFSKQGDRPRLVLGAIHTDAALDRPGTSTGSFLLVLWNERLCLTTASMEFVRWLEVDPKATADIKVVRLDDASVVPSAHLRLDPLADRATFEFFVPLGGRKTDPRLQVRVRGELVFRVAALEAGGAWRVE